MFSDLEQSKDEWKKITFLSSALLGLLCQHFTSIKIEYKVIVCYLWIVYFQTGNYHISYRTNYTYNHRFVVEKEILLESFSKKKVITSTNFEFFVCLHLPTLMYHFIYPMMNFSKLLTQEISMNLINKIYIKYPEDFQFPEKYGLCMNHSKDPYSLDHLLLFYGIPNNHRPYILERKNPKDLLSKIRTVFHFYETIPVLKNQKEYNQKSLRRGLHRFKHDSSPSTFVFFPEGTTKKEGLIPFRDGGFQFCIDAGCPIIVMCIILTKDNEVYLEFCSKPIETKSTNLLKVKYRCEQLITTTFKKYQSNFEVIN